MREAFFAALLEGVGLGALLVLVCAVGIWKGAVGMVHLYSPAVQARCVELGHRRIGFICDSPRSISSGFQRITGSRKAMEDHGLALPDDYIFTRDSSYAAGYQGASELLRRHPDLTAIFAHSDASAIGAMAALADAGRSVPGDVSVLGFDDTNLGEEFRPRLTCVAQPMRDIAARSLELLYTGMEQPSWEVPPTITLPHSLTVRESVRAVQN